jgi:hypothetical protein
MFLKLEKYPEASKILEKNLGVRVGLALEKLKINASKIWKYS